MIRVRSSLRRRLFEPLIFWLMRRVLHVDGRRAIYFGPHGGTVHWAGPLIGVSIFGAGSSIAVADGVCATQFAPAERSGG